MSKRRKSFISQVRPKQNKSVKHTPVSEGGLGLTPRKDGGSVDDDIQKAKENKLAQYWYDKYENLVQEVSYERKLDRQNLNELDEKLDGVNQDLLSEISTISDNDPLFDEIEKLRKEFKHYNTMLQNQVTKGLAASSGGGEVRLEFLDDVDRNTAKVDGKFLKFDSSSGKFVGDDASGSVSDETIQDTVGAMFSGNTETGITVTYQDDDGTIDLVVGTLNQDTTGNAATATALETARTIHGVSFDGTGNIDLTEVIQDTVGAMFSSNTETDITVTYQDADGTIDLVVSDISGNSATATALANARTIGGVSFDGTANINLPGVNTSGNQDTSGNAATATALETARTIHGVSFDGTGNIDLTEVIQDTVGAMFSGNTETNITATYQDSDGTIDLVVSGGGGGSASDSFKTISVSGQSDVVADSSTDTLTLVAGSNMTITTNASGDEITFVSSSTATALETARNIGGVSFDGTANIDLPGVNTSGNQDTSGNAATATALETARTINGTSFDGTANITVTAAAGTLTGNTLNSGVTASSLTSVGTLTTLTVDNVVINGTTIGHTDDTDLITLADGIVTVAGEISVTTLDIGGTNVTATATELNLLDGVSGLVQADFTKLAAVDSTAAELNIVDGGTSATSTTLADADRVVVNDDGTMVQVALTDFETYFESALDTLSNVTTVGTLNSGAISSGFGNIDIGSSNLTATGTISLGATSFNDNDITNVGDIALDSISADGTDINVAVSDNSGTAFTIKQGSDAYLIVDTGNSSESISIGTGVSGTSITLGHSTSEVTVADNLTVTGDLTVSGTTTTVNSTTVNLNDHNIVLDSGNSTSAVIDGAGITIEGGSGDDATFTYNTTGPQFELKLGSSFESLKVDQLIADSLDIENDVDVNGTLEADAITVNGTALNTVIAGVTVTNATNSAHVLVTDNESTNEENLITFVEGATSSTGNVGLEMDGNLTYNPSTGRLTATQLSGTLQTAAQTNVTSLGTLTTLTVDNVIINGTTIGHTDDTDLITLADGIATIAGELSVTTLDIGGTNITATATELNLMDGGTSAGTTAVAGGDGIVTNDGGTMRQTTVDTFDTYLSATTKTLTNKTLTTPVIAEITSGSTITLNATTDIVLDADGANVIFKDNGTSILDIANNSSDVELTVSVADKNFKIKGTDGTSAITALDLDMASAGAATFNGAITGGGLLTTGGNIVIPDAGTIGSASDTDAIAISSGGVVTMNQIPVFSAGLNVSGGTIAGTLSTAAQGNITSLGTLTTLTVDDITINGSTISDSGDFTLDVGGDITLDAAGEQIIFKDGSTDVGHIDLDSDNLTFKSFVSDKDIVFKGNDGGTEITALTLDMSSLGTANFNGGVKSLQYFWMLQDNNTALYSGANFEIALTHVHNTGFKLTNAGTGTPAVELQFVDSNESIGSDGTNLLLTSGGNAITVPNTGADTATLNAATQTLTNKTLTTPVINGFSGTGDGSLTGNLTLTSTDSGSGSLPLLTLTRNSSSPADYDYLGAIVFNGEDSASNSTTYASINGRLMDRSDTTEDGRIEFFITNDGTSTLSYAFDSTKFTLVNEGSIEFYQHGGTSYDVTLAAATPSADRTITLPDATGTVSLISATETLTNKTLTTPVINGFSGTGNGSITGDLTVSGDATLGDATTDEHTINGSLEIVSTTNEANLTIKTTFSSETANTPDLKIYNNSTQSGDDNELGLIQFFSNTTNYTDVQFADISGMAFGTGASDLEGGIRFRFSNSNQGSFAANREMSFRPSKIQYFTGATNQTTTLQFTDPTADRTITLPDATGTFHLSENSFERTLLVTTTVSDVSSVDFNSTYITDTFNTYDVVFTNIHSASDNVALRCRMGDSDSAITGTAYSYIGQMRGTRGTDSTETANYYDNSETYMAVTPNDADMYLGTASTENFNCHLRFFNMRETDLAKGFEVLSGAYRTSDSYWASWYQGIGFDHDNFANKRNFITFYLSSGNIASGTVKLYGLNL